MKKKALKDQNGIFQHFQSNVTDYNTRENYLAERGGKSSDPQKLYGIGPEHPDSYQPKKEKPVSLSTRYVPGRPGVQALRVSTGVFQDPNTKEMFDYNEGFVTSDGRAFRGGSVDLQTDLVTLANRLDKLGLVKEATILDNVLLKIAEKAELSDSQTIARHIINGVPYELPEEAMEKISELLKLGNLGGVIAYINHNDQNLKDNDQNKINNSEDDNNDIYGESVGHDPELSGAILAAALQRDNSPE